MWNQLVEQITYTPPFEGLYILYYIAQAFFILLVFQTIGVLVVLLINKKLAFVSNPYISKNESPNKILILGDSTAVGTGASNPEDTIGGMLAHDFPQSQIINYGVNGSTIDDLPRQISQAEDKKFKLVIISSGGNDTWKLSRMKTIKKHLRSTLSEAIRIGDHKVFFLINNQVGSGPFPSLISAFLTRRARKINDVIAEIAWELKVPVIDIFSHDDINPLTADSSSLLASDGIHPSSKGYAVWYYRMWRKMVQMGYHYNED